MTEKAITIKTSINSTIDKVWKYFNSPNHVVKWNNASEDWHTPVAENDLTKGGKFNYRMEAKDGSFGFDFEGVYDDVQENKFIAYTMGDGRQVTIDFIQEGDQVVINESFDPEELNPIEMQRDGWLSILNNFKKYAEAN